MRNRKKERKSSGIFQDWADNTGNTKGRIVLVFYRLAALVKSSPTLSVLFFWYLPIYKFVIGWFFNIEINPGVKAGKGFKLEYGYGSVVNGTTVFGENCTLRQLTTITSKKQEDGKFGAAPKIGNNVDIGVNVTIIGDVQIGNNVIIGAGAVITKDVDENCVMVGNPAKLLKKVYGYPDVKERSLLLGGH